MLKLTKPPLLPYWLKKLGIFLIFFSFAFLITYLVWLFQYKNDSFQIEYIKNDSFYNYFKLMLLVGSFFTLFSKDKDTDERIIQFKMVQLMKLLFQCSLFAILGQFMLTFDSNSFIAILYTDASLMLSFILAGASFNMFIHKNEY